MEKGLFSFFPFSFLFPEVAFSSKKDRRRGARLLLPLFSPLPVPSVGLSPPFFQKVAGQLFFGAAFLSSSFFFFLLCLSPVGSLIKETKAIEVPPSSFFFLFPLPPQACPLPFLTPKSSIDR